MSLGPARVRRGCNRKGCLSLGQKRPALVLTGERDADRTVFTIGSWLVCAEHEREVGIVVLKHFLAPERWQRFAAAHEKQCGSPPVLDRTAVAFIADDHVHAVEHDLLRVRHER